MSLVESTRRLRSAMQMTTARGFFSAGMYQGDLFDQAVGRMRAVMKQERLGRKAGRVAHRRTHRPGGTELPTVGGQRGQVAIRQPATGQHQEGK